MIREQYILYTTNTERIRQANRKQKVTRQINKMNKMITFYKATIKQMNTDELNENISSLVGVTKHV